MKIWYISLWLEIIYRRKSLKRKRKIIVIEITYCVIFMECMKKVNLALHEQF